VRAKVEKPRGSTRFGTSLRSAVIRFDRPAMSNVPCVAVASALTAPTRPPRSANSGSRSRGSAYKAMMTGTVTSPPPASSTALTHLAHRSPSRTTMLNATVNVSPAAAAASADHPANRWNDRVISCLLRPSRHPLFAVHPAPDVSCGQAVRSSGVATAFDVPLHSPEFHMVDPYPVFKELRREQPVYWCAGGGYWAITKYDDGLRVHRDPETFCSGQGMTMRGGELEDVKGGETLITLDPPRHTRQRQLVSRAFTPRAVAELEPRIREIVRDLLSWVDPGETIDFVEALSAPLPIIVVAELLGVPIEDRDRFVAWTNASIGRADPEYAQDESLAAAGEMYRYFVDVVEQRRRQPRADLISRLVAVEAAADDFTADDLLHLCFLLLAAGNETTRNLISGGVLGLIENPGEKEKLRSAQLRSPPASRRCCGGGTP
jgi:hypothetical protein